MAIPYNHQDIEEIIKDVEEYVSSMSEDEFEARILEGYARCDCEYRQWLSYYDDNGHLKSGARHDPKYIPEMSYEFLSMPKEKRAAFIISEKKRMGLL